MGLEDPVDAALALCGVDALCYDGNEPFLVGFCMAVPVRI